MTEEFITLDESHLFQAVELFKSAFAGEPWHDDWSNQDMLLEYIKEVSCGYNALNFGFVIDGKLVAIALGGIRHWWKGANYNIEEFCVSPDAQKKGIGSRFLSLRAKEAQKPERGRSTGRINYGIHKRK